MGGIASLFSGNRPPAYGGMNIFYDPNALEATEERLFPASKNRSKRIHKKLVKRFGGEFRKVPCIWRVGTNIIAHPSFRPAIEAQAKAVTERVVEKVREDMRANPFQSGPLFADPGN